MNLSLLSIVLSKYIFKLKLKIKWYLKTNIQKYSYKNIRIYLNIRSYTDLYAIQRSTKRSLDAIASKIIYRGIRVKEEVNISYQPSWMRINGLQDLPNSCGNGGNVSTSDTMGSVTISIGSCSASVTTYCSVVVGAITVVSLSRV